MQQETKTIELQAHSMRKIYITKIVPYFSQSKSRKNDVTKNTDYVYMAVHN